jgi:hypothetical protein
MSEQSWLFAIGTLVAVGAYFSKNLIFEPLLNFRKTTGRIHNRLRFHANIITNGEFPKQVVEPIQAELRQLSCDFEEAYWAVAFARELSLVRLIISFNNMDIVASNLIFLSNTTGKNDQIGNNLKKTKEIDKIFGFKL